MSRLTILGGGPAGLACGHYAGLAGLPFEVFEAGPRTGGNAVTHVHDEFRFDSGAHRFHDKDPEITSDVRALLGSSLREVTVPSHIYDSGRLIDFPLSPLNVFRSLGLRESFRAASSLVNDRLRGRGGTHASGQDGEIDFEGTVVRRYGRRLAERFLLNYSEKLWGVPPNRLASSAAAARLRGLDLRTFATELLRGARAKTNHLDGAFLYPELGIGELTDALASSCGAGNLFTNHRVTGLRHDGRQIREVEFANGRSRSVERVASSLPLDLLPKLLDPPLVELEVAARRLRYRSLVLVVLLLDRERVTRSGTIYFPNRDNPWTRLYEPKNRSTRMSPFGKTSLCIEIPCSTDDELWNAGDSEITRRITEELLRLEWFGRGEVISALVERMVRAYPVLDLGYQSACRTIVDRLAQLENLQLLGRNARFEHASLHHMLRQAKDLVARPADLRAA